MIPGFPELDPAQCQEALAAGDILVFSLPVTRALSVDTPDITLTALEQARFHRFQQAEDAQAFLAGRRVLRACLSMFLEGLAFGIDITDQGKPFCPHPRAPQFNLSHGGGWLTLAFCRDAAVGVDVESLQRRFSCHALAKRFFSPAEITQVEEEGQAAFIKIWTMKEARLKASGEGLRVKLSELDLSSADWQFYRFNPEPSVQGVLAYPGNPRQVWQWVAPL